MSATPEREEETALATVLLWDVDGTLLTTDRAGVPALADAVDEVYGERVDLSGLVTAGLTDAEVAALVIERCGRTPHATDVQRFLRAYERRLPGRLREGRGRPLPGVLSVLEALAGQQDVASLLLTGNTEAGATAKLIHYGLDGYFGDGCFCRDTESRVEIAHRARRLAERLAGPALPRESVYVIGDTPHDVRCGRAIGARTVGVASGPVTRDELATAEPWLLLPRLPEPARFMELLQIGTQGQ